MHPVARFVGARPRFPPFPLHPLPPRTCTTDKETDIIKTAFILAASLAAMLATTATPALARPEAPAVRLVHYSDLDLGTAAGRDRLRQRVDAAVRDVCGAAYPTDLRASVDIVNCRTATRAAVVLPAAAQGAGAAISAGR
jgi:UrcA family protein